MQCFSFLHVREIVGFDGVKRILIAQLGEFFQEDLHYFVTMSFDAFLRRHVIKEAPCYAII